VKIYSILLKQWGV